MNEEKTPTLTKRQQYWLDASEQAGRRRQEVFATFCYLLAQPNEEEQAEIRRNTPTEPAK